jgi:hypothetical protein
MASEAGKIDSQDLFAQQITSAAARAARKRIRATTEEIVAVARTRPRDLMGLGVDEFSDSIRTLGRDLGRMLVETHVAGDMAAAVEVAREAMQAEGVPGTIAPTLPGLFGDEPLIRFPSVDRAAAKVGKSPVFAGRNFRETAAAVQEGHFGITAEYTEAAVREVRGIIADNLATGPDRERFVRTIRRDFRDHGSLSEGRWRMVFRTNAGSAISRGMERSLASPFVEGGFPYRAYVPTKDKRTRVEHRALRTLGLNGTNIYYRLDPVWLDFRPPWDYNCRCAWYPVTVEGAAQAGVQEARRWMERAKRMASDLGGLWVTYLAATERGHQDVNQPPFIPSPQFRRDLELSA